MNVTINGKEYTPSGSSNWDQTTLGALLKDLRNECELSQVKASSLAGISLATLSKIEGDVNVPSFETAIRLARLYEIPLELLALPMMKSKG